MGRKEELEVARMQKLQLLGNQMHLLLRTGQNTDKDGLVLANELIQIDRELFELTGDRTPEKGEGICPLCRNVLESGVKFCGSCGANVDEYYSKNVARCDKCNSVVSVDDNFCPVCGCKREA